MSLYCVACGVQRCDHCPGFSFPLTEDITAGENIGSGHAANSAVDEHPSALADKTSGFQTPPTTSQPEIISQSKAPTLPQPGAVASEDPQQTLTAGLSTEPYVPFTDSGYATVVNPLTPGAQLGRGKKSPSASCDVGLVEDDAETTYSAATTVAYVDVRHYISVLSREIIDRLGQLVDMKQLAGLGVLPTLIKAFGIMIGQEDDSQINRDIMYFVYKHHR